MPSIDASALPLSYFQSGLLRQLIETECALSCLDLVKEGKSISVVEEQALKETLVPVVFFKALDNGMLVANDKSIEVTQECFAWIRREVRSTAQKLLENRP